MLGGEVMTEVQAVLGVAGGFVVAGVLSDGLAACHYDLRTRRCRAAVLMDKNIPADSRLHSMFQGLWVYDSELHCLVVSLCGRLAAWDLSLERLAGSEQHSQSPRVAQALRKATSLGTRPPQLVVNSTPPHSAEYGWLDLDERTGRVEVFLPGKGRRDLIPLKDGQPALRGWYAGMAQLCGSTLALALFPSGDERKGEVRLALYRLTDGAPLGEYRQSRDHWAHVLSDDGRLLAWQSKPMEVTIRSVLESADPSAVVRTTRGEFHSSPLLMLGNRGLVIRVDGRIYHLIRWDQGILLHTIHNQDAGAQLLRQQLRELDLSLNGIRPAQGEPPLGCSYDPWRFQRATSSHNLSAAIDRFGQVFLFNRSGRLLAGFFAYDDQFAAWLADGACLGSEKLLGRRSTPNAPFVIGRALLDVSEAGERATP
jgi:hypothetical protein